MKFLLSITLLLGVLFQLARSELRTELVQVLMRHGERTPRRVEMYPNDPYNESTYEPMGLGQLTNLGKMSEYTIGKMLRQRYDDFLGHIYRPDDVYAVSTDVDRTKMSLLLALAGLYPPTESETWNTNLSWMPVPIRYIPESLDVTMKAQRCPVYKDALKQTRESKEVRQKMEKFRDFFKFLSEKTGIDMKESSQVYEVYNLLTSQKSLNLTLPDWCTDDVYRKIQEVVVLEYEIRSFTTELKRLNGGMIIKKFYENMNVSGERKNPRKIYIYSGHEVNIAAFARAHNLSEPKLPAYGSAILVEKLRNEQGKLFVRMLLWTGVTKELITFKLPGCDEICPIEKYQALIRPVLPSDDEESCLWKHITKEEIRKLYDDKVGRD